MRFFALSALTALTFGLLSSAAPAPLVDAAVDADDPGLLTTDVVVDAKRGVHEWGDLMADASVDKKWRDSLRLEDVLGGIVSNIKPIVKDTKALTEAEVTLKFVNRAIAQVKWILKLAIADINNDLLELDINTVLATGHGRGTLLDVGAVAKLICAVLRIVLELLQLLLSLCVKIDITSLVSEVVSLLVELLSCVLKLVGSTYTGLIAEVLALIADLVPFILSLKITALLDILCIKL